MNQFKKATLILMIILLIGFTGFRIYQLNIFSKTISEEILPVKTAPVERGTLSTSIDYVGTIEPAFTSSLTSEVTAPVSQTVVKEGQYVKNGELLVILDSEQYESKLKSAQKKVETAVKTEAYLRKELERLQILQEEGAVSQKALDDLTYQYETAAIILSETEIALQEAKDTVKKTNVYSPFDGYINKIFKHVGDMAVTGQPLLAIECREEMMVRVNVTQNDLKLLNIGDMAKIKSGDGTVKTSITHINQAINLQQHSASVEIGLTDKQFAKLGGFSGMSVEVNFITAQKNNILFIPRKAVLNQADNSYVFVAENDKAHKKHIKTGVTDSTYIEVMSGLNDNQKVIVSGLSKLYEGCPVMIYEQRR